MIMIYDMTVTSCQDLSGVYPKCSHCVPVSPSASSRAGELDPVADRTVLPFIGVIFALVFLIIYMVKASGGQPHPKPCRWLSSLLGFKRGALHIGFSGGRSQFFGHPLSGRFFLHTNPLKFSILLLPTILIILHPLFLIPVHVCF